MILPGVVDLYGVEDRNLKTLAFSLLLASGLFAQAINNNPNIVIFPGTETYLLRVRPGNASTTLLRYAVAGTRADGTLWNFTGLVVREKSAQLRSVRVMGSHHN